MNEIIIEDSSSSEETKEYNKYTNTEDVSSSDD